jgi:hypothetical protein
VLINAKNIHVYCEQQTNGGFNYFVTFDNCAPWDTTEDKCIECVSEIEAHKLKDLLIQLCNTREISKGVFK